MLAAHEEIPMRHIGSARSARAHPVVAAVLLLVSGSAVQAQQTRDLQREAAIERNLATAAPGAVAAFRAATAAMDGGRCNEAVVLFKQVAEQAPRFAPARRRLGSCLVDLGQLEDGVRHLESALAIERTPETLYSLASSLYLSNGRGKRPSLSDAERALPFAQEAARLNQDANDPDYLALTAQIAMFVSRFDVLRSVTDELMTRFPRDSRSHYYAAVVSGVEGNWMRAERQITEAGNAGVRRNARMQRTVWGTTGLVGAWAAGLVFLFAAGKTLSSRTIRSIQSGDHGADVSPAERSLRQTYRRLIAIAGSYYYISLPFVILAIVLFAGLVVYVFMLIGRIPIYLLLLVVLGGVVTIFRIIQTLFIKLPTDLPGRPLAREEAPGLWALAAQVAEAVGTRSIDEIRITPGTEIAVHEAGTRRERREDRGRRVLIVGVGLLAGFRQAAFCAVLAHEYGHFAHRDTAGGDIALSVRQDMHKLVWALVNSGQARSWNVGWQFLRLYDLLFRRIAHGATRLQEVLADRVAARHYGADHFEEGLRHVARRQLEFVATLQQEVQRAVEERRAMRSVYDAEVPAAADLEAAIDDALTRPTNEDDTHPAPVERFALVRGLVASRTVPDGAVWDLFANRATVVAEAVDGYNRQLAEMIPPSESVMTPA
jgi:tetratricopeptide (TPR) repeat protein